MRALIITTTLLVANPGNIASEIEAEVSDVDQGVAVMNIPGFNTRVGWQLFD